MTARSGRGKRATAPRRVLDLRYVSPEDRYAAGDRAPYVASAIALSLYGAWVWLAAWQNPFGWTPGEQLVAAIAGIAGAHWVGFHLHRLLHPEDPRAVLAACGSGRLQGVFEPGRFALRIGGRWIAFDARSPHHFTMREHRLRHDEGRAEERARMDGLGQRPDHYRRAWQIVLDAGARRYELAAVADEDQARTLIRALHTADAFATGNNGAGTRTSDGHAPGAAPRGTRPGLE